MTTIQSTFTEARDATLAEVTALIESIGAEIDDGALENDPRIVLARQYQGFASYYLDYAYAANGYGFHASDYCLRILGQSTEAVRNGEKALLGASATELTPLSELSDVVTLTEL